MLGTINRGATPSVHGPNVPHGGRSGHPSRSEAPDIAAPIVPTPEVPIACGPGGPSILVPARAPPPPSTRRGRRPVDNSSLFLNPPVNDQRLNLGSENPRLCAQQIGGMFRERRRRPGSFDFEIRKLREARGRVDLATVG